MGERKVAKSAKMQGKERRRIEDGKDALPASCLPYS